MTIIAETRLSCDMKKCDRKSPVLSPRSWDVSSWRIPGSWRVATFTKKRDKDAGVFVSPEKCHFCSVEHLELHIATRHDLELFSSDRL